MAEKKSEKSDSSDRPEPDADRVLAEHRKTNADAYKNAGK